MKVPGELVRLKLLVRKFVVQKYLKNNKIPKLHIGCGDHIYPGWLNCDKFMAGADIYLNVYAKFPFESNTFEKAYSEHMIEHLNVDKVQHFLSEVYRTLKPGGIFRLTCPDFDKYATAYANNDNEFYDRVKNNLAWKKESHPDLTWVLRSSGGAFVASILKDYFNHKWMYDFETLESCLKEVGFSKVIRQDYQKSIDDECGSFDEEIREFESLYIDAIK